MTLMVPELTFSSFLQPVPHLLASPDHLGLLVLLVLLDLLVYQV